MRLPAAGLLLIALANPSDAQEEFKVYTDHPRLLLNQRRQRLLKRERERQSMRWEQLQALISGGARMPEPGFAWALYHSVTGDPAAAAAAAKAVVNTNDIRQIALVYDWCYATLEPGLKSQLAAKLNAYLQKPADTRSIGAMRDRLFAAIAMGGDRPTEFIVQEILDKWWKEQLAANIRADKDTIRRSDAYPLVEIFHAVRDNFNIELRENTGDFFRHFPVFMVLSYYPAPYPAAENEYRIPMYDGKGEPDLDRAALARAADLAYVAYDSNAQDSQFLQGWLMQDRFLMRGTFGAPYEFLWANPYQPGLSYYHLPNLFHDPDRRGGRLIVRSSWDEDAVWFALVDGVAQLFKDGKIGRPPENLRAGAVQIMSAKTAARFALPKEDVPERYFILGLQPRRGYAVEVDDEEVRELQADAGGVLSLDLGRGSSGEVRVNMGSSTNTVAVR